ncbi:hypothetical protein ScPMuIL_005161 [Solemya velum]
MQSSLSEIESVVNGSARVNIAQLVGWEDGTSLVPVRDWQSHLGSNGKILKGIKQYHHFRFDSAEPGMVFAREVADSPEETAFRLFSVPADLPRDPPAVIPPPDLDLQRQSYYLTIYASLCQTNGKTLCALTLRQPQ